MTEQSPATADPATRAPLPRDALFLAASYPREGRNERPDLCSTARMWLGNHGYFRATVPQIDNLLASFNPFSPDTEAFARNIANRMQALLGGLSGHHGVEDSHYFPAFRTEEPRLGAGFDVLDTDHGFIHDAIDRLVLTTNRIVREFGGSPTPGALRGHLRDDFREELRRFGASLTRHLDDEEDLVIPFLLHRNGAERLAA